MSCCCFCPWFSIRRAPESARLIEETYRTVEMEDAFLEPSLDTSGEKSLSVKPLVPTGYLNWGEGQIRSIGTLLSRVLQKAIGEREYPIIIGRRIPREGFFYEVAIFSSEPRMAIRSLMYACLYGGDRQRSETRSNLHKKYTSLPYKSNGMVSLPISEVSFDNAFKVMTYEKVDIFLKDNAHLILVVQEASKNEFSNDYFFILETTTQKIIRKVLEKFPGFSWVSYFDPGVEVLTKHLHFFVVPKKRAQFDRALSSEHQRIDQRTLAETVQSIFKG